jgi:hypothetical protein
MLYSNLRKRLIYIISWNSDNGEWINQQQVKMQLRVRVIAVIKFRVFKRWGIY